MNQPNQSHNQSKFSQEPPANSGNLLFEEEWFNQAVLAEKTVGYDVGAGLDWGSAFGELMLDFELLGRLKTLRISLNREVRLLINKWSLGITTKVAVKTARERLIERLRLPTPIVRESIKNILQQDELYSEEFISDQKILQELIGILLTQEDWEIIATVAADSLKQQIMHLSEERIFA